MCSNVCWDGGHIIRPPEYRPGSLCMYNTENLKIWQAPTSLLLMPLNVTCCDIPCCDQIPRSFTTKCQIGDDAGETGSIGAIPSKSKRSEP